MSEKMGIGLQDLLPRFTCTRSIGPMLRRTFFGLTFTKKGVVEAVEGVTLVGPQ